MLLEMLALWHWLTLAVFIHSAKSVEREVTRRQRKWRRITEEAAAAAVVVVDTVEICQNICLLQSSTITTDEIVILDLLYCCNLFQYIDCYTDCEVIAELSYEMVNANWQTIQQTFNNSILDKWLNLKFAGKYSHQAPLADFILIDSCFNKFRTDQCTGKFTYETYLKHFFFFLQHRKTYMMLA